MATLKIILRKVRTRGGSDADDCSKNSDWFVHKTTETFIPETTNQTKRVTQVIFFIYQKIRTISFVSRTLDVAKAQSRTRPTGVTRLSKSFLIPSI